MKTGMPIASGVSVGVAICARTNKYVLVRNIAHPDPLWKITGGTIEENESSVTAMDRELLEETGLTSCHTELLLKYNARRHPFYVHLCVVNGLDDLYKKPVKDGDDLLEARAFTLAEVLAMCEHTENGKMVPLHLNMFMLAQEKLEAMNRQEEANQVVSA